MTRRFETVLMIVLLLLCLPAVVVAMSSADGAPEAFHPTITEVKGQVEVKSIKYPVWEEVQEGMLLLTGDILRTKKGGFARIEFASGIIELYETTVMVIPSIGVQDRKKDIQEVIVDEGKALFDIDPLGVERGFEFRTKNIQGGVKGTLFTVSYLEGGTAVNVYRGKVQVSDLEGSEDTQVELLAGYAVRVENRTDFSNVQEFDPESGLEEFNNKVKNKKSKDKKSKDKKVKEDKED